jgi:8-oxo-dGTP pyrophosphatase MutT (NUDIX family)
MRRSEGALALIRRDQPPPPLGHTQYLAQWNEKWHAYNFVGGHRHPDETFRACLQRELAEELNVQPGEDYRLDDRPPWHLEYSAFSESAQAETAYVMELFAVELLAEGLVRVAAGTANRWLTEAEIRAGADRDGRPVSRTVALLLEKAGLLLRT